MIETISQALAPIIFVTALGWCAGRWGILQQTASKPLATFVVSFALPIALLLAAAKTRPEQILNLPYVATLASGLIGIWLLGLLLMVGPVVHLLLLVALVLLVVEVRRGRA